MQNIIVETINARLYPRKEERLKRGEVFTPLKLVNDMLDRLPKEVWTNKDLTWFDPANGIGNYPIAIYLRLMDTLVSVPVEDRSKHIIENMLFMNEIAEDNCDTCVELFRMLNPDAKINISRYDFLEAHADFCGRHTFDIIIGNPPYNPPKRFNKAVGQCIWQHFVFKSFYMLNDRGYLCFVHPVGWKKPTEQIYDPVKFDILGGCYYKYTKNNRSVKQIRQGCVWNELKNTGSFTFICTNNNKKTKNNNYYVEHFPAHDYYVYCKGALGLTTDTVNYYNGNVMTSNNLLIPTELTFLPIVITSETIEISQKLFNKNTNKLDFKRGVGRCNFLDLNIAGEEYVGDKYVLQLHPINVRYYLPNKEVKNDNIQLNKFIFPEMFFNGIENTKMARYIKADERIGVSEYVFYFECDEKQGKLAVDLFTSNVIQFLLKIHQYVWGACKTIDGCLMRQICVPTKTVKNYYKWYDIEQHKTFIEAFMLM
jgi:hypothetical protein